MYARLLPLLVPALATCSSDSPTLETARYQIGEMTVHFVSTASDSVIERAMAHDMNARGFGFMGPEDFHYSVELEGYPFTLITTRSEAQVPQPGSGLYEHEFVHMAAAQNVMTRYQLPLARLMRPGGCEFTSSARFHEVCADWDNFVAPSYGSATKMQELLSVIEPLDPEWERTDAFVGRVDVTGIDLIDSACLWDLGAIHELRQLYDAEQGEEAFDALFPPHNSHQSCVEEQMSRAVRELGGAQSGECVSVTASALNVRPQPSLARDPRTAVPLGTELTLTGEEAESDGIRWIAVTATDLDCTADTEDACWVSARLTQPCN